MTVWREVEDALEAIIEKYERVNHIISLFQDDWARKRGLERAGMCQGTSLELGSGPGNFTSMLYRNIEGDLVCLDYSAKMLSIARSKLMGGSVSFVRSVFEALPFRYGTIELTAIAYAFRDSTDKIRALTEVNRVLRRGGKLLIIDIGKPNNPLVRGFFSLYMRYVVPILGGLSGSYNYRNPWSLLYKTYELLPVNEALQDILRALFGSAFLEEYAFGGLFVAVARSKKINRNSIESELTSLYDYKVLRLYLCSRRLL